MTEGARVGGGGARKGGEAPVVALKVPGERGRRPLLGDARTLARLALRHALLDVLAEARAPADALADGLLGLPASCLELCGGEVVEVAAPTGLGGRAGGRAGGGGG